MWVN